MFDLGPALNYTPVVPIFFTVFTVNRTNVVSGIFSSGLSRTRMQDDAHQEYRGVVTRSSNGVPRKTQTCTIVSKETLDGGVIVR